MKKFLLVLVVAAAGWFGYQYTQTGSIPFLSSAASTPEQRELDELADRFQAARSRFTQALKASAVSGMDMTADADAAVEEIKRVEAAFLRLKPKLLTDAAKQQGESLGEAIRMFKNKL